MSARGDHSLPDDLLPVAAWLREERPRLDGIALDRAKTRARGQAAAARRKPATHRKGALLKSRIAITMILALGILMSLSGAGLAVTGLASSGGAADVQYSSDHSSTKRLGGPGDPSHSTTTSDVRPAAQQSTGKKGKLPFTGFAAIPVLVGGVALLGSGLVLRRRSALDGV